ncbi:DsbE family thiol:disulfide interchange protein [Psychromonas ossibalaenae]|uniref:DsbE family thiol:disulfide interchange protein n=1 Tax=Psychromonas ossibalaenae TaxID=444922 RepID=UPI00035C5430|nr:DsbE family thiol:disulfide interchange protein [Psychromonas ossibalaenae]
MNNKKTALLLPSLIVGLVIILLVMGLNNKNNIKQAAVQPKPLPAFQLNDLQTDQPLTETLFTEQIDSEYTLLNVWASWCAVCKIEHPFLLKLAEQGVNIVGLNYRDNQQTAVSLLAKTGNPYQKVIFDPAGKLALDLGVIGTPESYLINKQGMIIGRFNGALTPEIWTAVFQPVTAKLTTKEG